MKYLYKKLILLSISILCIFSSAQTDFQDIFKNPDSMNQQAFNLLAKDEKKNRIHKILNYYEYKPDDLLQAPVLFEKFNTKKFILNNNIIEFLSTYHYFITEDMIETLFFRCNLMSAIILLKNKLQCDENSKKEYLELFCALWAKELLKLPGINDQTEKSLLMILLYMLNQSDGYYTYPYDIRKILKIGDQCESAYFLEEVRNLLWKFREEKDSQIQAIEFNILCEMPFAYPDSGEKGFKKNQDEILFKLENAWAGMCLIKFDLKTALILHCAGFLEYHAPLGRIKNCDLGSIRDFFRTTITFMCASDFVDTNNFQLQSGSEYKLSCYIRLAMLYKENGIAQPDSFPKIRFKFQNKSLIIFNADADYWIDFTDNDSYRSIMEKKVQITSKYEYSYLEFADRKNTNTNRFLSLIFIFRDLISNMAYLIILVVIVIVLFLWS